MKAYIVVEKGQEYNDEIYTIEKGGTPIICYYSREQAEKQREISQTEALKGQCLSDYCYDIGDIINTGEDDFLIEFEEIFGPGSDLTIPKDATHEQIRKISNYLSLDFFDVVEVDFINN